MGLQEEAKEESDGWQQTGRRRQWCRSFGGEERLRWRQRKLGTCGEEERNEEREENKRKLTRELGFLWKKELALCFLAFSLPSFLSCSLCLSRVSPLCVLVSHHAH